MTWVLCAGMIRSGSTLQYQIASSLVEHARMGSRLKYIPESEFVTLLNKYQQDTALKVAKVHVCTLELAKLARKSDTKIIYCYRDIRDVSVSAMRKFNMTFDALVDSGWLDQAITDYYAWTDMPNVLISRYEDMVLSLKPEISKISDFLSLPVDLDTISKLSEEYEISVQKKRTEVLKEQFAQGFDSNELVYDEKELLHHNHIHKGEIGGWVNGLSSRQQTYLTERYEQWLYTLGYDIE
jgi:hypothetical protein